MIVRPSNTYNKLQVLTQFVANAKFYSTTFNLSKLYYNIKSSVNIYYAFIHLSCPQHHQKPQSVAFSKKKNTNIHRHYLPLYEEVTDLSSCYPDARKIRPAGEGAREILPNLVPRVSGLGDPRWRRLETLEPNSNLSM